MNVKPFRSRFLRPWRSLQYQVLQQLDFEQKQKKSITHHVDFRIPYLDEQHFVTLNRHLSFCLYLSKILFLLPI